MLMITIGTLKDTKSHENGGENFETQNIQYA